MFIALAIRNLHSKHQLYTNPHSIKNNQNASIFAKRMIIFGWDRRKSTLINLWHTLPREEDCCSKYLNYKVFLLCSVITLSVYLLLVKIDGSPSNFFHLFHKSYTCHLAKHFVSNITFCYGLFIYEMQLISDIFFMPSLSLYILGYRVKQKILWMVYKYWNSMYRSFLLVINIQ